MRNVHQAHQSDPHQFRQTWPFFIILTLINLFGTADVLRDIHLSFSSATKSLFIVMVVVLTAGYWMSPFWVGSGKRIIAYCLIQGSLTFALSALAPGHWLMLALYGALVGNAFASYNYAMAGTLAFFA